MHSGRVTKAIKVKRQLMASGMMLMVMTLTGSRINVLHGHADHDLQQARTSPPTRDINSPVVVRERKLRGWFQQMFKQVRAQVADRPNRDPIHQIRTQIIDHSASQHDQRNQTDQPNDGKLGTGLRRDKIFAQLREKSARPNPAHFSAAWRGRKSSWIIPWDMRLRGAGG